MSRIIYHIQEIATDTLFSSYTFKVDYALAQKYEELMTHAAIHENPDVHLADITFEMCKKACPFIHAQWRGLVDKLWAQAVTSREGYIPSKPLSMIQTAIGRQYQPDATTVEQARKMEYYELKYFILHADQDEKATGLSMGKWLDRMPREFAKWSRLGFELFTTLRINQQ